MTETGGDRELIIGNKQLISLFFVVVALCGVFFAMGYMIGRNSTKAALADAGSSSSASSAQRQQPEPPGETAAAPPESGAPEQPTPAPVDSGAETKADTSPAQDSAPVPSRPEPRGAESVRVVKAASGISAVSSPEAGASYLQVTALPRLDADGIVKTLREQNFPTILATSSKDGLFRVLVGPYHQTSQLAEAKSRLKTIGFGSAFVQKQ
jgi:cell division septation protein DedD